MVRRSVFREAVDGAARLRGHRLLNGIAVGGFASVAHMMPFRSWCCMRSRPWDSTPLATGCGYVKLIGALPGGLIGAPSRLAEVHPPLRPLNGKGTMFSFHMGQRSAVPG